MTDRIDRFIANQKPKRQQEWALYKGEELLAMGTMREIADAVNVSEETIYFYSSPAYEKRVAKRRNARVLVNLEEE